MRLCTRPGRAKERKEEEGGGTYTLLHGKGRPHSRHAWVRRVWVWGGCSTSLQDVRGWWRLAQAPQRGSALTSPRPLPPALRPTPIVLWPPLPPSFLPLSHTLVAGGVKQLVAVKRLKPEVLKGAHDLKEFLLEGNLMRKLKHP
jgi:hypothetical protein